MDKLKVLLDRLSVYWLKYTAYLYNPNAPLRHKKETVLLCFFLGVLGAHRWYLGYRYWWVQLLCLGGLGAWAFVDLARLSLDKMTMANGQALQK
jgi:hypothetical protein